MKERPILFSAPMVRAIIEEQKIMTRRVIKFYPIDYMGKDKHGHYFKLINYNIDMTKYFDCPYGKIGDRLWVRETFNSDWCDHVIYRADGGSAIDAGYAEEPKWKPSIFMPRKASRINLEITNVRVERLNDISDEDAIAEGVESKDSFIKLWEFINGVGSWEANPFVWVIEFKKLKVVSK